MDEEIINLQRKVKSRRIIALTQQNKKLKFDKIRCQPHLTAGSANITTNGSNTTSATNCVKAVFDGTAGASVHEVEFIVEVGVDNGFGGIIPTGCVIAKRRVAAYTTSGTIVASAVQTIGTDITLGTVTTVVSVDITVDTTNNRIVPTVTKSAGVAGEIQTAVSCRITSHNNRK